MPEYFLKVERTEKSGDTGVRSYHCRVVEKLSENDSSEGPIVIHSCDQFVLERDYEGDPDKFVDAVASKMIMAYLRGKEQDQKAEKMGGTHRPITLPDEVSTPKAGSGSKKVL